MCTYWYSLVRFMPEPERLEGANVGVIVIDEHAGRAAFRAADEIRGLETFFGFEPVDAERVQAMFRAFRDALGCRVADTSTRDDLANLGDVFMNAFRLSEPRRVAADDLDACLADCFDAYVAPPKPTAGADAVGISPT